MVIITNPLLSKVLYNRQQNLSLNGWKIFSLSYNNTLRNYIKLNLYLGAFKSDPFNIMCINYKILKLHSYIYNIHINTLIQQSNSYGLNGKIKKHIIKLLHSLKLYGLFNNYNYKVSLYITIKSMENLFTLKTIIMKLFDLYSKVTIVISKLLYILFKYLYTLNSNYIINLYMLISGIKFIKSERTYKENIKIGALSLKTIQIPMECIMFKIKTIRGILGIKIWLSIY